MNQAIFSSAYLGSVGYYSALACFDQIWIEQYDSYHKQTYRNRCSILGANGPLDLIVPVVKKSGCKTLMKDIEIDYSTKWQLLHWRSLFSAYNSSPFFQYYSDYFSPFYQKKHDYLIDFNNELMEIVLELLQMPKKFILTSQFEKGYETAVDLRNIFTPKKILKREDDFLFNFQSYSQTFAEKFDFIPDLSIVDLLFNCGPDSESILIKNIKHLTSPNSPDIHS